jgi:hypothetical protein
MGLLVFLVVVPVVPVHLAVQLVLVRVSVV